MVNVKAMEDYVDFLKKYLAKDPDALAWVLCYTKYVHEIDDIIDEKITDPVVIIRAFEMAALLYGHIFYQRNFCFLYPLVKTITNAYQDSVVLERGTEMWQKRTADALRVHGNELIIQVIEMVGGYEARREASMALRELSWRNHHNELGDAI